VAAAFAERGARLALHGHAHVAAARDLAERLSRDGTEAAAFAADLAMAEGCAALAKGVRAWAGGPPTGIVHAAGPTADGPATRLTEADWDRVIGVHLSAAWRLAREPGVAPGGFLILVGSGAGRHGREGQAAYAAAKAGVLGLTEALAGALGPDGVRVHAVLPGPLDTNLWRALTADQRAAVRRRNALPAIQTVADVAAFIAALSALPAASGQVFDLGSRVPGPW
jgi:3-oxoacyl-[acyl-carrier protein] reductase